MTPERQAAANRKNARHSTRPRTTAGKNVSKYNAMQHGLRAEALVLPDEDLREFEEFRQALTEEFAPRGELEAVLVARIVTIAWRLRRVGPMEVGIFIHHQYQELARRARNRAEKYTKTPFEGLSETTVSPDKRDAYQQAKQEAEEAEAQAEALAVPVATTFAARTNSLANLHRYETTLERSLFKAQHELERLQARRQSQQVAPPEIVDVNLELHQEPPA